MSDGSAPIGFNPRTKTFNPGFSLSGMATSGLYNVAKSLVSAAMRGGGTTLGPKYKTHYRKKFSKKFKNVIEIRAVAFAQKRNGSIRARILLTTLKSLPAMGR